MATASASAASCGDGDRRQAQQQLHHLLHLRLLGAAVSDDRALDLRRRVLEHRQAGFDRGEHCHAARMSELQRAADVDGVKEILDRDRLGPALLAGARRAGCESDAACRETRRPPGELMAPHATMRCRDPSVSTHP